MHYFSSRFLRRCALLLSHSSCGEGLFPRSPLASSSSIPFLRVHAAIYRRHRTRLPHCRHCALLQAIKSFSRVSLISWSDTRWVFQDPLPACHRRRLLCCEQKLPPASCPIPKLFKE
ncbi:hypothetical protein BS47DRAFT_1049263 [Hydnum rufescens UP504]|uniref:Uncharacterized protein n=1 Tax=Hydnum rufescens UP504 TaxID=1448309 RepID=A0A9P6AVD3_9AGAM|nr:hypothetical protein BS47DRAFT_1049263 [Hydnum rufescens UP504]